jgi:DNA-directed RNA polymerase subunit K/omega
MNSHHRLCCPEHTCCRQFAKVAQPSTMATIGGTLVSRPSQFNAYEFVVIASLRAKQLLSGCVPRVEGDHTASTMAQMEVACGKVGRAGASESQTARQCLWQL